MSVEAGKLRHRIEFQKLVTTVNSYGEQVTEWQYYAKAWAQIVPLSAKEFMAAQQGQSEITARIMTRFIKGLEPTMRILHGSTLYNIAGILPDPDSGREWVTIPVSAGVNEG